MGVGGFRVLEIGHLSCWRWRGLGFGGLKVKWKLSKKRRRSKDIRKDINNLKIIKNSSKYKKKLRNNIIRSIIDILKLFY